jgi:nuclear migration protein JNM1
VRSESPSEDDNDSGVVHQRLKTDAARSLFEPAQVDAREADFSDRVSSTRKSYVTSHRRRANENGEEEDESLEAKLARLKREVEEVRVEVQKRETHSEPGAHDSAASLSQILDNIQREANGFGSGAEAQLAKKLASTAKVQSQTAPAYTITYAPSYTQSHALNKVADFDARLTLLEKALGIGSMTLPTTNSPSLTVIPSLEQLTRQVGTLTTTSASSLDVVSRKVRQLIQEADKLSEARKVAKIAREEGSESLTTPEVSALEDAEQRSKINALYGTLSTIESLAPLLPMVIERLRSLRLLHTDAAQASEDMSRILEMQDEMTKDIKTWSEGLDKLESKMRENELTASENMKAVEKMVKDLEQQVETLK